MTAASHCIRAYDVCASKRSGACFNTQGVQSFVVLQQVLLADQLDDSKRADREVACNLHATGQRFEKLLLSILLPFRSLVDAMDSCAMVRHADQHSAASRVQYPDKQDGMSINTVEWLTCLAPVLQLLLHAQQQTGQQKRPFHQAV